MSAPDPVTTVSQSDNPFAWVDEAWREVSTRTGGGRFNVWTTSGRFVGQWATKPPALAAAIENRPAKLFDGFDLIRVVRPPRAKFRKVLAKARALADAPDGTAVKDLHTTPKRAAELAVQLAEGVIRWSGFEEQVEKVEGIRIELQGRKAVVRRDKPPEQPPPAKKIRRAK